MRDRWAHQCREALHQVKVNDIYDRMRISLQAETIGPITAEQSTELLGCADDELRRFSTSSFGQELHQRDSRAVQRRLAYIQWRRRQPTRRECGLEDWAKRLYTHTDAEAVWGIVAADIMSWLQDLRRARARARKDRRAIQREERRRLIGVGRARRLAEGQITKEFKQAIKDLKKEINDLKRQDRRLRTEEQAELCPHKLQDLQSKRQEIAVTLTDKRIDLRTTVSSRFYVSLGF